MARPLPVVLASTAVSYAAADPIGTRYAMPLGIRNVEEVGVLIDKLVMSISGVLLPTVSVELRWRNEPLTNGFVPLPAMTWPQNRLAESSPLARVYTLELARPIYLPPGEYIDAAVRNDLSSGSVSAFVLTGIGRQAIEPAERWLPYLTSYFGPAYTDNSGNAISDQSSPPDLGNPFGVPLYVDRMIGRVLNGASAAALDDLDPTPLWNTFSLRVTDHMGNSWVPMPTPMGIAFNAVDRSWLMHHMMQPKGYLRAEFEGTANVAGLGVSRSVVGLVGYRRIA